MEFRKFQFDRRLKDGYDLKSFAERMEMDGAHEESFSQYELEKIEELKQAYKKMKEGGNDETESDSKVEACYNNL